MNPQGFPGLNPQAMQQMMGAPAMQRPSSAMNMPVTPAVPTQPAQPTQPTPTPAPTPATAPAPAPTAASAPKPASASAAEAPSVNINDLLSKLLAAGIIGQPAKKEEEAPAESTTSVAPASDTPAPVASAAKLPAVASEQGKKVVPAAKPKVSPTAIVFLFSSLLSSLVFCELILLFCKHLLCPLVHLLHL